jgi:hypothetical protein
MSDVQNIKIHLVGDADLSQLDKELNKITKSEAVLKDQLKAVDTQAKATNKTLQDESAKSAKSVDASGKSFDDLSGKVKGLASQIPGAFQVEQVLSFAKATQTAAAGTGQVSGAMNVLKVAFASTGIGLLVAAFASLLAYFQRTDEGATKLEGIMGGLGAAFGEVSGYAAEIGSKIFDAATSFESFKEVVSDAASAIGGYILNRIGAPVFLIIDLFKAAGKAIEGDLEGASKAVQDAGIRFATGFEGVTGKVSAFGERMRKAAEEAYQFALSMDEISDAERALGVELSANAIRITELIKQSKNHSLSIDERRQKLELANSIEAQGLNKTLELEQRKLDLLKQRNLRELESINQSNISVVKRLEEIEALKKEATSQNEINKLTAEEFTLKKKLLSINDNLAKEVADQEIKINNIKQSSIALTERNNNAIAALNEAAFNEEIANIKATATAEENIYKDQFIKRQITEKQLQDGLLQTQLDSLNTQKALYEKNGRDTVEIDKTIKDLLIKQRQDADKEILEADKKLQAEENEANKANIERMKNESDYFKKKEQEKTEALKKQEQIRQQTQQQTFQILTTLATGFFSLETEHRNQQISALESSKQKELASYGDNKNAQAAVNAKFAKQEADIKRKQAVADKEQALFNIAISTASAIIKQFAATPLPFGAPLIALVAATGAAQLAFAAAKPIPKFNKGTKSVPGVDTGDDSVYAMLRPGEGIMPVDKMREYRPAFEAMYDGRIPADAINSLVLNYDNGIPSGVSDNGIKSELKQINRTLSGLKQMEVTIDKNGIRTFLKSENAKTEVENNYLRLR